jgi:hypothetical protein
MSLVLATHLNMLTLCLTTSGHNSLKMALRPESGTAHAHGLDMMAARVAVGEATKANRWEVYMQASKQGSMQASKQSSNQHANCNCKVASCGLERCEAASCRSARLFGCSAQIDVLASFGPGHLVLSGFGPGQDPDELGC